MDITQLLFNRPLVQSPELTDRDTNLSVQKASDKSDRTLEQLQTVAKNFEGIFIHQILKQMQDTIENASFDPEDHAGQQVHSMYCSFMADAVSRQGGFGMWEQIYEQLVRTEGLGQESRPAQTCLDESV
jgi:flagellar protein FlgJ